MDRITVNKTLPIQKQSKQEISYLSDFKVPVLAYDDSSPDHVRQAELCGGDTGNLAWCAPYGNMSSKSFNFRFKGFPIAKQYSIRKLKERERRKVLTEDVEPADYPAYLLSSVKLAAWVLIRGAGAVM